MEQTQSGNEEQAKMWNGAGGRTWVESQALLDAVLQPIEDRLVELVAAARPGHVLDVGCGTGSTTLSIARALAPNGTVAGIDISEPMIAAARERAQREGLSAEFILGDAQAYGYERQSFDMIASRFGIMFFADPVAAFANLRRAAAEGAELCLFAWRSPDENPFMTTAERAAAPLLPELPKRQPNAPGQFGFGDANHVRRILEGSLWKGIEIQPVDFACAMPADRLLDYVSKLGFVGRALDEADDELKARVLDAVLPAFATYRSGEDIRFIAACWQVTARAPSEAAE